MSSDLVQLAEALRRRIQDDTELLGSILKMMAEQPTAAPLDEWCPITEIAERTGGNITEASARWMARNRESNGTAAAFRKIGKRLLVNPNLLIGLQR